MPSGDIVFTLIACAVVALLVDWLTGHWGSGQSPLEQPAAAHFCRGPLVAVDSSSGSSGSLHEVRALLPRSQPCGDSGARAGGEGELYARIAAVVDDEWPGSGAGVERGVALTRDAATLVLGKVWRGSVVPRPVSAEPPPASTPQRRTSSESPTAAAVEAVEVLGYVRVEAAPSNVRTAHAASARGRPDFACAINAAVSATAAAEAAEAATTVVSRTSIVLDDHEPSPAPDPVMVVQGLVVAARARGAGLGRLLMAAVEGAVRELCAFFFARMCLTSSYNNQQTFAPFACAAAPAAPHPLYTLHLRCRRGHTCTSPATGTRPASSPFTASAAPLWSCAHRRAAMGSTAVRLRAGCATGSIANSSVPGSAVRERTALRITAIISRRMTRGATRRACPEPLWRALPQRRVRQAAAAAAAEEEEEKKTAATRETAETAATAAMAAAAGKMAAVVMGQRPLALLLQPPASPGCTSAWGRGEAARKAAFCRATPCAYWSSRRLCSWRCAFRHGGVGCSVV